MKIGFGIICFNEEAHIAKCLNSIIDITSELKKKGYDCKILLVDDHSTDDTLQIAKRYPITIIQNKSNYGAPATAYIAFKELSDMDYLVAIGADMILLKEGFISALDFITNNPRIGAISGVQKSILHNGKILEHQGMKNMENQIEYVDAFAGCGIYNNIALKQSGIFNPFLKWGEEGELCYRIIDNGYMIAIINNIISIHFGYENETMGVKIKKRLSRIYTADKLISASKPYPMIFRKRISSYIPNILIGALEIFSLLLLIFPFVRNNLYFYFFYIIITYLIGLIIHYIYQKHISHQIRHYTLLFILSIFYLISLIKGLIKKIPNNYQIFKYEIIKE